jgi:hypothetical protein
LTDHETVAEAFEGYRRTVIPAGASAVQIDETRAAFFAGAYFLLMSVSNTIGDPDVDEERGVAILEALRRECETFAAHIGTPTPSGLEQQYTTADAAAIRPVLQSLGRDIADKVPAGFGFTLLLFTFGAGGSLFYLSNADRADVLNTMREFLARQTQ